MTKRFETLKDFCQSAETLPIERAEHVRHRFVEARLDPVLLAQRPDALRLSAHADGPAYDGYLWDFFVAKERVDEATVWQRIADITKVYAMWDLHSADRVMVLASFRLPDGTVLRADPETLRRGVHHLPEDLYIFDDSLTWAAALTHEWVDAERFCLWSGHRDPSWC